MLQNSRSYLQYICQRIPAYFENMLATISNLKHWGEKTPTVQANIVQAKQNMSVGQMWHVGHQFVKSVKPCYVAR